MAMYVSPVVGLLPALQVVIFLLALYGEEQKETMQGIKRDEASARVSSMSTLPNVPVLLSEPSYLQWPPSPNTIVMKTWIATLAFGET